MASARFTRPTAAPASRASPAPTGFASHTESKPCSGMCGSEPARDGISAVWLTIRSAWIAGKPGSHRFCVAHRIQTLQWRVWERACSRWHQRGLADQPQRLHRGQARLPQVLGRTSESKPCSGECGSEPARDGIRAVYPTNRSACIAGKPGSHRFGVAHRIQTLQWRVWEQQLPSTLPLVMHRVPE